MGIATLMLESFSSRNVTSTVGTQNTVTTAMIVLDSYKALEKISENKKLQNVHTCILLEIVLRYYQTEKILEDGLEKQWFFDPVHIYLQTISKV